MDLKKFKIFLDHIILEYNLQKAMIRFPNPGTSRTVPIFFHEEYSNQFQNYLRTVDNRIILSYGYGIKEFFIFIFDGQGWVFTVQRYRGFKPLIITKNNVFIKLEYPPKSVLPYNWNCEGCSCYNDFLTTGWCSGKILSIKRKTYHA